MTIQIDTREKQRAVKQIISHFDKHGIKHYPSKLYVGDYMNLDNPRVIIDRKQNLSEIYTNVCQGHKRFCAELKRAQDMGIKIIILCEHGFGIKSLDDVKNWYNPRLDKTPYAWDGERLFKVLSTIKDKYGIDDYVFCEKRETGAKIVEILGV